MEGLTGRFKKLNRCDLIPLKQEIAAAIRADGVLSDFVKQRYSSFDSGIGAKVESGEATLADLEAYMLEKGEADPNTSGRQEWIENLINQYL